MKTFLGSEQLANLFAPLKNIFSTEEPVPSSWTDSLLSIFSQTETAPEKHLDEEPYAFLTEHPYLVGTALLTSLGVLLMHRKRLTIKPVRFTMDLNAVSVPLCFSLTIGNHKSDEKRLSDLEAGLGALADRHKELLSIHGSLIKK